MDLVINTKIFCMSESKTGNHGGGEAGRTPEAKKSPEAREAQELKNRILKALEVAAKFGQIGTHINKNWVIDQMIRELTGCPTVQGSAIDANNKPYTFDQLGESKDYKTFVKKAIRDPKNFNYLGEWNIGKAP